MGEKMAFLMLLVLFAVAGFPLMLDLIVTNLNQEFFMSYATQVHKLVQQEGGVTSTVTQALQIGENRQLYTIVQSNGVIIYDNNPVTPQNVTSPSGIQPIGNKITITYYSEWDGAFGQKRIVETSNTVTVARRR